MQNCWSQFLPDILFLPKVCPKVRSPSASCHPLRKLKCPFEQVLRREPALKPPKYSDRVLELAAKMYPKRRAGHKNCVKPFQFVPKHLGYLWCPENRAAGVRCRKPGAMSRAVRLRFEDVKARKRQEIEDAEMRRRVRELKIVVVGLRDPSAPLDEFSEVKDRLLVQKENPFENGNRKKSDVAKNAKSNTREVKTKKKLGVDAHTMVTVYNMEKSKSKSAAKIKNKKEKKKK